jgi:hypothetical protein
VSKKKPQIRQGPHKWVYASQEDFLAGRPRYCKRCGLIEKAWGKNPICRSINKSR